jgi:hypothetical protein
MRVITIICLLLFNCSNLIAQYCGDFPEPDFYDSDALTFEGKYRNYTYGYSLTIPDGLVAYGEIPPAPHHGFGIVLSWQPRSYVYVSGDYNSMEYESIQDIEQRNLEWLTEDSDNILSAKTTIGKLGPLKSIRSIVRHTCPKFNAIYVSDYTFAFSEDEILYTISLSTTEDRYEQDKLVIEKIIKSWKISRIK